MLNNAFVAFLFFGTAAARFNLKGNSGTCLLAHCAGEFAQCMANAQCRSASFCNAKCALQKDVDGCNLVCELTYGYKNGPYTNMLQCMVKNKCLPVSPMNGKCLATDNQTIANLTDMSQVTGKWWIVRGLNCGQPGWPGAFDYLPCQRDEFVLENGTWIDHIAYCGGKNNSCTTPIVNTQARAEMTTPGVMTHWYQDAPLLPQIEYWRVISFPHPDWMLYVYCGSTPAGPYAGGSVVTRKKVTVDAIPRWVEVIFQKTAREYGFEYDTMCISNVTMCMD